MPAAWLSVEQDVGDVSHADIAATGTHTPVLDAEDAVEDGAYDLPSFLNASTSRVRRRSELAFARNGKDRVRDDSTYTFELPALSPDAVARSRQMPPQTQLELLEQEDAYKSEEPSAGPSSLVPSLRYASSRVEGDDASYPPSTHVALARTPAHRRIARWQFAAFCFSFFLEGWNDGSTGPLLPTIQAFYGLNYTIVSMIFILNAVGFVLGAATLVLLVERFGMGKVCA